MSIDLVIQNLIEGIITALFVSDYIEPEKRNRRLFLFAFTVSYMLSISLMNYLVEYESFFCLIYTGVMFLVMYVFRNRVHPVPVMNTVIYLIFWNLICSIGSESTFLIYSILFKKTIPELFAVSSEYHFFFCAKLLIAAGMYIVNRMTSRYKFMNSKYSNYFIAVFILLFIAVTWNETAVFTPVPNAIGLILINFLLFGTALSAYHLFNKSSYDSFISFENMQLKESIKSIQTSKEAYLEDEKKIKALKHDLKNQFVVLNEYLKTGNTARGMEIIEESIREIDQTGFSFSSGFPAIDAIITGKFSIANRNGIDSTVSFSLSGIDEQMEYHIAIILGNLLDNAIENISKDKPSIRMTLSQKNDCISIMVQNTTDNTDSSLQTRKKDLNEHGLGIHSVNMIVQMYSGSASYLLDEGKFTAFIRLHEKP